MREEFHDIRQEMRDMRSHIGRIDSHIGELRERMEHVEGLLKGLRDAFARRAPAK
jgi:predicted  nucleic acid-binding Zn-ribbon protein